MRLLEFNQAENGSDIQQTVHIAAAVKNLPASPVTRIHPARKPVSANKSEARVFPIQANTVRTPAQRGPIDLEALQQRVTTLEKRIKKRASDKQAALSKRELTELKQRLMLLERNINNELWAAKQREYTMLEILAKPPLNKRIAHRLTHIVSHNLPAIGRWCKEAAVEWLQDRQPEWWPTLAAAWQESLDKARGISQH